MERIQDDLIIKGLRSFDERITKKYFYEFCQKAYAVYDAKYQLHCKTGLDFYSLAHDYYIQLLSHDFKPLLNKPAETKLSTWMVHGFHYVVLDALKNYNKEFEHQAHAAADVMLNYISSSGQKNNLLYNVAMEVASHYSDDRLMQEIAHMIFYAGYKQKDVAEKLGITPSAVNQRYKKMMEEVVTPFIMENYGKGTAPVCYQSSAEICLESANASIDEESISRRSIFGGMSRFFFCKDDKEKRNTPRITPNNLVSLKENEIFVFGSNLLGIHAGGAARTAYLYFGAQMGKGVGLQGRSYAIPTMQGGVETIRPYVNDLLDFARQHPELRFYVTAIGCGLAGFTPEQIVPLFIQAKEMDNVYLPGEFWEETK